MPEAEADATNDRPLSASPAFHGPCYRQTHTGGRASDFKPTPMEPPITPELIGILAVGATLIGVSATMIGLLLAFWRDARADTQALRVEVNAGLADVRKDVQALTERVSRLEGRMSRLEGAIEGFFAGRGPRNRHDDAA